MCPASRLFDSASPGRPCCLAKAKVRPKHIAGFLVPRPRMLPQWTRQTTGLHGPASTDTPASDTPRSAPSGLSARERRRCREQRWDKPGIDESHRQARLVSVWWDRAGMGRDRKAELPTDGGAIHPWGRHAHRRRHSDSNTERGVRASNAAQADRARGLLAQGFPSVPLPASLASAVRRSSAGPQDDLPRGEVPFSAPCTTLTL